MSGRYYLSDRDIDRLATAYLMEGLGFDGNPDTDGLVKKCLEKGYITENPKYLEEQRQNDERIAWLNEHYGPGNYSIGVGMNHHRWILTDEGKAFVGSFVNKE